MTLSNLKSYFTSIAIFYSYPIVNICLIRLYKALNSIISIKKYFHQRQMILVFDCKVIEFPIINL